MAEETTQANSEPIPQPASTPPPPRPEPTPHYQYQQPSQSSLDMSGMIAAVNAIPEKVAAAIKEMTPTTPAPKSEPESGSTNEPEKSTPRKKSFAHKWFGI